MSENPGRPVELFCPDGHEIQGVVESVTGVALIYGALDFGPNEELEVEYAGQTDVDWDTQETVYEEKERLFECINGDRFRESQLDRRDPMKKDEKREC